MAKAKFYSRFHILWLVLEFFLSVFKVSYANIGWLYWVSQKADALSKKHRI